MHKINQLIFKEDIIVQQIINIVTTVPGVDKNGVFNVQFGDKQNTFTVVVTILPHIINIYSFAKEVQQIVYFQLKKSFDLNDLEINVEVLSNSKTK